LAPQQAFILNASLRDNVLFMKPMNEDLYNEALRVSCLESDIRILPNGDMTLIGEKGINLSGGQKARVNLARAVYNQSSLMLLDDPLSAVDAHVGTSKYGTVMTRVKK
jgi:ABC-type multidrug transport system fused ATPase/permease subunit